MIAAHMFSYSVSTIFNGKDVIATIETAVDKKQKIRYTYYIHGFDIGAEDFVSGSEAFAFKEASEIEYKGEG